MKIGFKTALGAIVIAGVLGTDVSIAAAMPSLTVQPTEQLAGPQAEQVYYRCGYYGCRHRYYGHRYYGGYRRPYYRRGYYGGGYYPRPGIGIGIGGVGVGIY